MSSGSRRRKSKVQGLRSKVELERDSDCFAPRTAEPLHRTLRMNLSDACRRVELILSDVDGVLTDGAIWYDNQGIELKGFHIRDGLGIKLWQRAGFQFGVLTARASHIVKLRAGELGIGIVRQGIEDKLPAAPEIIDDCGLKAEQLRYIGAELTA